ncbi:MAG: hypothetical protein MI921_23355 [Cytophagales bacterium]|nr:hypothetical protein [Cytophagales bacterium]
MRITSCIFLLNLFVYGQATAQSWIDHIPAILQEDKANMIVSSYFADKKLFNQVNHMRRQKFQLEPLPFDTTGQYTKSKKELNRSLQFISQNINMIPIRHNSQALRKVLNFEDSGQMLVSVNEINDALVERIFERNINNTLDNWLGDQSKNSILRLKGLSAVAAMKLFITFEKEDNAVRVIWKYASSYTLNKLPENMVRTGSQSRISPLRKP